MHSSRSLRILGGIAVSVLFTQCGDEPPGLQQRITELEARLTSKQQEIADLQSKLQEARNNGGTKDASTAPSDSPGADVAAVGAAAEEIARKVEGKMKSGSLSVSSQVAYAGFTLKTASRSTGIAVPFFRESASSTWHCGWSEDQIQSALAGMTVAASSPAAPEAPTPQIAPAQAYTASVAAPMPARPEPKPLPPGPPPAPGPARAAPTNLPQNWRYDAATGQVIASDGTPMPALKQGERYGMIPGSAGDTPRPVVVGADGTPKLIVR